MREKQLSDRIERQAAGRKRLAVGGKRKPVSRKPESAKQ
jgi:hypothetical protein